MRQGDRVFGNFVLLLVIDKKTKRHLLHCQLEKAIYTVTLNMTHPHKLQKKHTASRTHTEHCCAICIFPITISKVHAVRPNMNAGVYLPGGSWLDVSGADVLGPPLQTEVVGRLFVLLTGQIELQILLAELRAQECSKHWHTSWGEEEGDKWSLPHHAMSWYACWKKTSTHITPTQQSPQA